MTLTWLFVLGPAGQDADHRGNVPAYQFVLVDGMGQRRAQRCRQGAVRADFERSLAGAVDPAIASADIASELRWGADYVRITIAFTVVTADVADALAIAWDAFRSAARMTSPAGR